MPSGVHVLFRWRILRFLNLPGWRKSLKSNGFHQFLFHNCFKGVKRGAKPPTFLGILNTSWKGVMCHVSYTMSNMWYMISCFTNGCTDLGWWYSYVPNALIHLNRTSWDLELTFFSFGRFVSKNSDFLTSLGSIFCGRCCLFTVVIFTLCGAHEWPNFWSKTNSVYH